MQIEPYFFALPALLVQYHVDHAGPLEHLHRVNKEERHVAHQCHYQVSVVHPRCLRRVRKSEITANRDEIYFHEVVQEAEPDHKFCASQGVQRKDAESFFIF